MHPIASLLTALCAATAVTVSVSPGTLGGPDREPADRLFVTHDGKRVDVKIGETFQLTIDGKPIELVLGVEPTRIFETDTFRFEYPRGMSYSYDGDEPESWDLESANVNLSMQFHDLEGIRAETFLKLMTNAVAEQYEDSLKSSEDGVLDLGGVSVKSRVLKAEVLGQYSFTQTLAVIPGKEEGTAWVFVLTEDGDGTSADAKRFRDLLRTTWKLR